MTAVAEEITGVEAGTTERTKPDPDVTPPKPKAKAETKGGPLLTLTGTKLAEHVHNLWKGQNQRWARRLAEWRMNDRRRNGEKNLYISKKAERDQYDVLTPPGMGMMPIPVYNKADRLCQRLGSQQFADDYQPDVEPAGDTDDAKDAAQLAERALEDLDSEGNLNDTELQREAFDLGHSGGSGYILYYPDPYAGGRHPVTLRGPDVDGQPGGGGDGLAAPVGWVRLSRPSCPHAAVGRQDDLGRGRGAHRGIPAVGPAQADVPQPGQLHRGAGPGTLQGTPAGVARTAPVAGRETPRSGHPERGHLR